MMERLCGESTGRTFPVCRPSTNSLSRTTSLSVKTDICHLSGQILQHRILLSDWKILKPAGALGRKFHALDERIGAMTKSVRAAKSAPVLPLRPSLSSDLEGSDTGSHKTFVFPPRTRLIITTTKGVYSWDSSGVTEIFRSGSEGIVAAKKLESERAMLAVADSQVVILHEVKGGTQKSYRLKGSEVCKVRVRGFRILLTGISRVVLGFLDMPKSQTTYFSPRPFRTRYSRTHCKPPNS